MRAVVSTNKPSCGILADDENRAEEDERPDSIAESFFRAVDTIASRASPSFTSPLATCYHVNPSDEKLPYHHSNE